MIIKLITCAAPTCARAASARGPSVMDTQRESRPQLYQIRVRGRLGQTTLSAFPALRARAEGGDTVLTGLLPD